MNADSVSTLARQLGASLVETHISWVLLADELAWKIKKPVRLGFLDFGTLDVFQNNAKLVMDQYRLGLTYRF